MKGRYIQLHGNKSNKAHMFDRTILINGYTHDGRYIPQGGVSIGNGNLAGYINQSGGDKKWRIIGKINYDDPNSKYIPEHQLGGVINSSRTSKTNRRSKTNRSGTNNNTVGGESKSKPVSLKTAVSMLRNYYRTNFN